MSDYIYPLNLGDSIEPSATLSAWGFPKSSVSPPKPPKVYSGCDDNLYPLNLGDSIDPSATLEAWGYGRNDGRLKQLELERRYKQIKDIVLGNSK